MKRGNKVQTDRGSHMFLEKFQDPALGTARLVAQTNAPALLAGLVINQDHITAAWWN